VGKDLKDRVDGWRQKRYLQLWWDGDYLN
jgi:hypothetical protein